MNLQSSQSLLFHLEEVVKDDARPEKSSWRIAESIVTSLESLVPLDREDGSCSIGWPS